MHFVKSSPYFSLRMQFWRFIGIFFIIFYFLISCLEIFILTKLHLPPKKLPKMKEKLYIYAKIMGSIFHYINYAMKIKSKHLKTFTIMKNLLASLHFFHHPKKCKMEKNMNWFFLWIHVCLNRCVYLALHTTNPKKTQNKILQTSKSFETWN
jgi:hypothetical protein